MSLQSAHDMAVSDPGRFKPEAFWGTAAALGFRLPKGNTRRPEGSQVLDDVGNRQAFSDPAEDKILEQLEQLMKLQHGLLKLQQDLKIEVKVQKDNVYAVYQAYQDRLDFLKEEAKIEKIIINKESESDFWSFIKSISFIRKGSLFLEDNGNLRSTWKDGNGNHLGLQFYGKDWIQYVIFKRRTEKEVARVAGRDNQQGIKEQIRAFDLKSLLQL